MSRARIFILAWTVILTLSAVAFYAYVAMFGKPRIGKLNLFAPEPAENTPIGVKSEGWLGALTGSRDLYPAKEVDLHIDLGESEKNYLISVDRLSQVSLSIFEEHLKDMGITYRVAKEPNGYKVEIDSPSKAKMQARLEMIKTLNLTPKN